MAKKAKRKRHKLGETFDGWTLIRRDGSYYESATGGPHVTCTKEWWAPLKGERVVRVRFVKVR